VKPELLDILSSDAYLKQNSSPQLEHPKLQEAISSLTEKQKNVIHAIYFLGFTQKQLAATLNVTPQAVCKIHKNAIISLKSSITGDLHEL